MNIYFSGSIRGGRDDTAIYFEIIELLKNHGSVLTEYIGDSSLSSYGQTTLSEEEIYNKDTTWIRESDIVVAEVTTPSLGVGYEIGYAESIGKKIVCLYRPTPEKRLSAMITGNKNITVIEYETVDDLKFIF